MDTFFQQIINGLTLGGIYSLIALGYTMVYGVLLMINFAHSEIFMLGSFAGYFLFVPLFSVFGGNKILLILSIFVFAAVITGFIGFLIERFVYKPLRKAPRLAPLISSIGVSIFLQNVMMFYSSSSVTYPEIITLKVYHVWGLIISNINIFIIFTSIFLMLILKMFISKTRLGKAMRAVAQDKETAALMGINVNGIISLTFVIGAALGSAGGILNGVYYGSIKYNMGFLPGIKAFTAAVLGGIGNIGGAMFGGFILGIAETLAAGYISSMYKDVFAFIVLILILIFKPSGLLGQHEPEKV